MQPTEPMANTAIADALQHANARNYADAYVTAMFFNVATLLLAFVCACALHRSTKQKIFTDSSPCFPCPPTGSHTKFG